MKGCSMEVGISRRTAIAGGVAALCGAIVPQVALAEEAKTTLGEIETLVDTLNDNELVELEEYIRSVKAARGIQSMPLADGSYVAGSDIDPGSYTINTEKINPDSMMNFIASVEKYNESAGDWETVDSTWSVSPGGYSFTIEDGMRLKVDTVNTMCMISPTKKISF